jgi:hypothetical protein
LRRGAEDEQDPVAYLTALLLEDAGADVPVAAIQGLVHHRRDSAALLGLARRLHDPGRLSVARYLITSLKKVTKEGGLILLRTFFCHDRRTMLEKVGVLQDLVEQGLVSVPDWTAERRIHCRLWILEGDFDVLQFLLRQVGNDDLRAGLIVGAWFGLELPAERLEALGVTTEAVSWAVQHCERRLPGLVELVRSGPKDAIVLQRSIEDYMVARRSEYRANLEATREQFPPSAYAFAAADWQDDHTHPQCLHDSWLDSVTIAERHPSDDQQPRMVQITISLLGPLDSGYAKIEYLDVVSYQMDAQFQEPKSGLLPNHLYWAVDEVRLADKGRVVHEILWAAQARWLIECGDMRYRWLPIEESL